MHESTASTSCVDKTTYIPTMIHNVHRKKTERGSPNVPDEVTSRGDEWAKTVSEVTVLCSASRGGSSLLFRILAASAQLTTTRGEESPFIKATIAEARNSHDDTANLDRITGEELKACRKAIFQDVGIGVGSHAILRPDIYVRDLAHRIPMQWSRVTSDLVESVAGKFMNSSSEGQNQANHKDAYTVFKGVLLELERKGLADSRYYDRDPLLPAPITLTEPSGPPLLGTFVEEPPFIPILPRLRRNAMPRKLLLKASSNSHRLPLIGRLFPNARIKILHLIRNPAASVNGLMDGWGHWGFFSRDVFNDGLKLDIKGYTDRYEWGRNWWNFDLPQGWKHYTTEDLETVCAFQWRANHQAVLRHIASSQSAYLRIRFEDIVASPQSRMKALSAVADFLGVSDLRVDVSLPGTVMSTRPPSPRRWLSRKEQIMRVVESRSMTSVIEQLGYDTKDADSWI